jgi:hypothetical protein
MSSFECPREHEMLCYGSTLSFSVLHHSLGRSRECRIAAISTREDSPAHMYCGRVGDSARTLFMSALKTETGLDLRSSGATLLSEDGAIDVQVPSATGPQVQAGSGMIFRMRPRRSEWTAWRAVGPGVRYRDYEMGLARFPTPAEQTAEVTGPIDGASEVRLRFTLRLGQEQCSHTRSGRANGGKVAQVIVFRDTRPATDAIRAWTHLHPHGINLHHTRLLDGAGMDLTDDTNLARTGRETPSPRSFAPPGSRRSKTRRPAVASTSAPCPLRHSRGCEATLPCREDAMSSLGEGGTSLSQTLGPLRGVHLASHWTWEVQCRSFKAKSFGFEWRLEGSLLKWFYHSCVQ